MKSTLYIFCVLIISSCQAKKDSSNKSVLDALTPKEIETIKEMSKQESKWDEYDKKEKSLLGLMDFDKLKIKDGKFAYQFSLRAKNDQYYQVFEIIENDESDYETLFAIKYKVSRDCHPSIGNRELTKDCIQIIERQNIKIDKAIMASLNDLILQNGFWESTENPSEIRRYMDLINYHGESWSIKGAFAIDYPNGNFIDTTVIRTHRVNRMIPSDFKAFYEIGNRIKSMTNEGMANDNK